MKNIRLVFMGTPEFAVASLGTLLMNGYNIAAVVTAPDKPAGRGKKITRSAVAEFAADKLLPLLQPDNLSDPEFISTLKALDADYFIVVAFRKLPPEVWSIPKGGTINLHASLLPHYRGAAPINHVIINGETKTGVTTFFINDKIDTGNILIREQVPVHSNENAGDLHDKLSKTGARTVIKTLKGLESGTIFAIPQSQFLKPGEIPGSAPKIFPENCIIDWTKSATQVNNLVRGLSPYPGARTNLAGPGKIISFKIFESRPEKPKQKCTPGEILTDCKSYIKICCGEGILSLHSVQIEGRKRMTAEEFLRGFDMNGMSVAISLKA
jgi:methionyl-tRNA formyltransferase